MNQLDKSTLPPVAWTSPETNYWINVVGSASFCALFLQALLQPPLYFLPLFFILFLGLAMYFLDRYSPRELHGVVFVEVSVAAQIVENLLRERGLPYHYTINGEEHLFKLTFVPLEIVVSRPRTRRSIRVTSGSFISLQPINDETEPHITSLRQAIEKAF